MADEWNENESSGFGNVAAEKPSGFGFGGAGNDDDKSGSNNRGFGSSRGGRGGGFGGRGGGFGGGNRNRDENNNEDGNKFNRRFNNNGEGGEYKPRFNRDNQNSDSKPRFGGNRQGFDSNDGEQDSGERKPRSFGGDRSGNGFSQRSGSGFGDRSSGGGGGFGDKSGGDRSGGGGGFGQRSGGGFGGDRSGGERSGFNRNQDSESRGFSSNRGGFNRDRDGGGDSERPARSFRKFEDRGDGEQSGGGGGFGNKGGFGRNADEQNGEGGGKSFSRGPRRDDNENGEGKSFSRGPRREENENGEGERERERYIPQEDDDESKLFQTIKMGINFNKQNEIPCKVSGAGSESIVPFQSFSEAPLTDLLQQNIRKSNYEVPTPVQRYSLPIILQKRDLMACAQTGSGKTAAYLLPIMTNIMKDGLESSGLSEVQTPQALILSPTRELAIQIYNECRKFSCGSIIKSSILYGGVVTGHQLAKLSNGCNILVATPGRLKDVMSKGKISLEKVKYFVLDEADRMLDMGFEPDVREILTKGNIIDKTARCTFMFSATFPESIQKLAHDYLNDYLFLTVGTVGGANSDVEQIFYKVPKLQKRQKLIEVLNEIGNEKTMIFMEQKKNADSLAFYLQQKGYPTTSIHGDRFQSQREEAIRDFKSGTAKIIVCTAVAARGLDIDKVNHVINLDLPKEVDEFVHRVGRTGRCGNLGKAISFFDPDWDNDRKLARPLVRILLEANQTVPDWLNAIAEDSYGTTFDSSHGKDDLREKFKDMGISNESSAPASSAVEEEW